MQRSYTIGVLSPLLGGFYFGSMLSGIHSVAQQRGMRVLGIQTIDAGLRHPDQMEEVVFDDVFAWDVVDAWVSISNAVNDSYLQRLKATGKPLVTISALRPELGCPAVLPDNRGGVFDAVRHLIEHGHTRIGFAGFMGQDDIIQRYAGYKQALEQHGLELDPAHFFAADDNLESGGRSAGRRILEAGLSCSAIIAGTDLNAIGMLEVLQTSRWRVPEDLAIIGFDDIDLAQTMTPPLSSVRQRFDLLGVTAAELLARQLDGAEVAPGAHYVPVKLIPRASCGCNLTTALALLDAPHPEGQDWHALLPQQLARLIPYPIQPDPDKSPEEIWPGVTTIVSGLRAAVEGHAPPVLTDIARAWREAVGRTVNVETLTAIIKFVRKVGSEQIGRQAADPEARVRLDTFLDQAMQEMITAPKSSKDARIMQLEGVIQRNYDISMAALGGLTVRAADLSWLDYTPMDRACLALWDMEQPEHQRELMIVGRYSKAEERDPPDAPRYRPAAFPSLDLLPPAEAEASSSITMLLPLKTLNRAWGVLLMIGSPETQLYNGIGMMRQWSALLTAALEREALLQSLEQQQGTLRTVNHELTDAKRAADAANHLKSQFLANMSHELRTPLNAIINFTRFMSRKRHGTLNDKQLDLQQRVIANGEHLLGLINDILDLSKIEAGRMDLMFEEIDISSILEGVLTTTIGLTKDKGLKLELQVEENLPLVHIDRTRIRQVLLNLLSNAAKFTEAGSIVVSARRSDADSIEISVQDSGIGIAPEHQELVFEEFRQIQGELTREYQGTGLGLPITKRLVELHGGTMWLKSEPGQGSTFFFTLPAQQPLEQSDQPQVSPAATRNQTVVVVDDNQHSLQILQDCLEGAGYAVHTVIDSRQALATIKRVQPGLVILDVMMPYMDGWEVLAQLKNHPKTNSIPIIICSITEHQRLGIALGASGYIVKPVQEEQLVGLVNSWIQRRGTVLIVDDSEDARSLVRSMLETEGYDIVEATNGQEALATLDQVKPDLIVLDLMMPKMDGFEVLERLRSTPRYVNLPVVVVSAKHLSSQEHSWLLNRSVSYIQKSQVSPEQFLACVRSTIRSRGQDNGLSPSAPE